MLTESMKKLARGKYRSTIKFSDFKRMCFTNTPPRYVNIDGRCMEWVGFGVIDVGEAEGTEPRIVEG